jgi:DNA repair exonuclease SbcCD ATPase subunit
MNHRNKKSANGTFFSVKLAELIILPQKRMSWFLAVNSYIRKFIISTITFFIQKMYDKIIVQLFIK